MQKHLISQANLNAIIFHYILSEYIYIYIYVVVLFVCFVLFYSNQSLEDKGFYKWSRCVSVMCNYVLLIEVYFSIRFLMIECLACGLFSNYNQSFLT